MIRNSRLKKRSLFTRPPQRKAPKKPLIRYILVTAFRRMLMAFGAMFLISLISVSFLLSTLVEPKGPPVYPNEFVLDLTIEGDFSEYHMVSGPFGDHRPAFRDVVDIIDAATADKRVKGLLVKLDGRLTNISQIQELRAAVLRFRDSGRFANIYATSYGGLGQGMGSYYFASAFDEIWMQPVGVVSIPGVRAEVPFVKGALDKAGIEPQFFARKEYKSVFESFTSYEMSAESREMLGAILGDISGQIISGTAEGRGMTDEAFSALVDVGLLTYNEALDAGLVSRTGSLQDLKEQISVAMTGKPGQRLFVDLTQYRPPRFPDPGTGSGATAVIYVTGNIISSAEMVHAPLFFGRDVLTADQIEQAIMDATDDPRVGALVIRVDSPGGSPVAAEMIRMALVRAKEAGKLLVVSMGATAASGGYWVAAPADIIFANPGTLTGSIGVAGGKVVFQQIWEKLGVNWDAVQYGDNADMMSFNLPFSQEGEARMDKLMDSTYEAFIARVAEGRDMTPEAVDEIARGRVWTGNQAKGIGLVDELGGLAEALDYTAESLGYQHRFNMPLQVLPEPKSPFEMLVEALQVQAGMGNTHYTSFGDVRQLLEMVQNSFNPAGPVAYEPLKIR